MASSSSKSKGLIFIALLCVLLYSITVFIRLESVQLAGLQSDERLWISRSAELRKRFNNDLRHVTSHLPHPGATSAAVMAMGLSFRDYLNQRRGCLSNKECELHILDASRIAITLFTSLFIPLFFLALIGLLGAPAACFTSLLVALDPRITFYMRMAHIDGTLTFFLLLTVFLYLKAVSSEWMRYSFLSGISWGFSLLTKPTATLIAPVLVIYRLLRSFLLRVDGKRVPFIQWRDFWLIVVSQIVFAFFFTRLWDIKSAYISRLHVKSAFARFVLHSARELNEHQTLLYALFGFLAILICISFLYWYKKKSSTSFHIFNISAAVLSIYTAFAFFPVVLRNLILYWTWVSGLSGVKHEAFGQILSENTAPGYFKILTQELPTIIIIVFFIGVLLFIFDLFRSRKEQNLSLLALLLLLLMYLGFLNTSSKQALRYALPVLPIVYLFAVFGIVKVLEICKLKKLAAVSLILLVVNQAFTLYSWRPYYQTYFNSFAGGLKGAQVEKRGHLFAGQIPAIFYLVQAAKKQKAPLYITIVGDKATAESVKNKYWPDKDSKLNFGHYPLEATDYLLVYRSHIAYLPEKFKNLPKSQSPEFTVDFKNTSLVDIYKVPVFSGAFYKVLELNKGHRHTGKLKKLSGNEIVLSALKSKSLAGYLYFSDGIRLSPGTYTMTVRGNLKNTQDSKPAIKIEMSSNCNKVLTNEPGPFSISLSCTVTKAERIIPRVYWFATNDLQVDKIEISAS